MTPIKDSIEKFYGFSPSDIALDKFKIWQKLFVEYNSHTNLMSKNDLGVLFEKHVLDSLAITMLDEFKNGVKLLDVGCGGGFPSLILSVFFPSINVVALDSVSKKIKFLSLVKNELELSNLEVILGRAEDIDPLEVDILTNRAVGKIDLVWNFSKKHLKKGGLFVSYKALTAHNEAKIAQEKFKELDCLSFIPYKLPLKENPTRELVVFKKV